MAPEHKPDVEPSTEEKEEPQEAPGFEKERLAALTDGVFAVAMTLLVVDLATKAKVHEPKDWGILAENTGPFVASFLVVALYWIAHHNEYAMLTRVRNRWAIWLNVLFLFPIVLLPLPLALAGQRGVDLEITQKSLGLYMIDIGVAGLFLAWFFFYAAGEKSKYIEEDKRDDMLETHLRNLLPAVVYLLFGALTFRANFPIAVSWGIVIVVPVLYVLWQVVATFRNRAQRKRRRITAGRIA
jgi:TMEM175 potassium channel family protein